jgi:hypothetical protein
MAAPLRVAVIGGNLLGCATALQLSRVAEADADVVAGRRTGPLAASGGAPVGAVVLFEARDALGGNQFRSVKVKEAATGVVEVGSARVLTVKNGSGMETLMQTVNGGDGLIKVGNIFEVKAPWAGTVSRGKKGSVKLLPAVDHGGLVGNGEVGGWAVWEPREDSAAGGRFLTRVSGASALDAARAVLDTWAASAGLVACAMYFVRGLLALDPGPERALGLVTPVFLLVVAAVGAGWVMAKAVVAMLFSLSTAMLTWKYGRGVTRMRKITSDFAAHIGRMNENKTAALCLTPDMLLRRVVLEKLPELGAAEIWKRFKRPKFGEALLEPRVSASYGMRKAEDVHALAAHFALVSTDFGNMEAAKDYKRMDGGNAKLCDSLLEAASANLAVKAVTGTRVTKIVLDEKTMQYAVTTVSKAGGATDKEIIAEHLFDGVILCANVRGSADCPAIDIVLGQKTNLTSRLGTKGAGVDSSGNSNPTSPASHTAVVHGSLRPEFFGLSREGSVPDRIQVNNSRELSFFERAVSPRGTADGRGVYVIDCSSEFKSPSGIFSRMFDDDAIVLYFEPRMTCQRDVSPIAAGEPRDAAFPNFVLDERLVYAAAGDYLGCHPEMDILSSANAASMFSAAVPWETATSKSAGAATRAKKAKSSKTKKSVKHS